MNKQQAMRVACARTAMSVQGDMDIDGFVSDPSVKSARDARLLLDALQRLRDELMRRASDEWVSNA